MKELERCRISVVGTEMKLIGARGDQGLNTDEQKLGHGGKRRVRLGVYKRQ